MIGCIELHARRWYFKGSGPFPVSASDCCSSLHFFQCLTCHAATFIYFFPFYGWYNCNLGVAKGSGWGRSSIISRIWFWSPARPIHISFIRGAASSYMTWAQIWVIWWFKIQLDKNKTDVLTWTLMQWLVTSLSLGPFYLKTLDIFPEPKD